MPRNQFTIGPNHPVVAVIVRHVTEWRRKAAQVLRAFASLLDQPRHRSEMSVETKRVVSLAERQGIRLEHWQVNYLDAIFRGNARRDRTYSAVQTQRMRQAGQR